MVSHNTGARGLDTVLGMFILKRRRKVRVNVRQLSVPRPNARREEWSGFEVNSFVQFAYKCCVCDTEESKTWSFGIQSGPLHPISRVRRARGDTLSKSVRYLSRSVRGYRRLWL